jgi:hypothetical protein
MDRLGIQTAAAQFCHQLDRLGIQTAAAQFCHQLDRLGIETAAAQFCHQLDRLGIQTAAAQFCHQFVICILYQEDTNTTFNNISVISWRSVLLVNPGIPGENH